MAEKKDPLSGVTVGINWEHHQTHNGETYQFQKRILALSDDASATVWVRVPAGIYMHLKKMQLWTDGAEVRVLLHEGGTATTGVAITSRNRNRGSSQSSTVQIYYSGTITTRDTGIELDSISIGGGGATPSGKVGGGGDELLEWILKPSTDYQINVLNKSGAASIINVRGFWYEQDVATSDDIQDRT